MKPRRKQLTSQPSCDFCNGEAEFKLVMWSDELACYACAANEAMLHMEFFEYIISLEDLEDMEEIE